jgi:hypothetical protein
MVDDASKLTRHKHYGPKSTATTLLEADNMSIRHTPDGGAIVELFRYGSGKFDARAVESFQMYYCPEDWARIRKEAR